MIVKVFGPGCAKCNETEQLVKDVAAAANIDVTVEKVSDFAEMAKAGVLSTPAVVVNGETKCTGRAPSRDELKAWLGVA